MGPVVSTADVAIPALNRVRERSYSSLSVSDEPSKAGHLRFNGIVFALKILLKAVQSN
jgi:hypothetical protein